MLSKQELSTGQGPVYRRIADAIASAFADGRLQVGEKLPPHREIARETGVNLTTVTRAFAELRRRGLVDARPGRGTIVVNPDRPSHFQSFPRHGQGFVDLSVNRPATIGYLDALARIMPTLARDPRYGDMQDFHAPEGPRWARETIGAWLAVVAGLPDGAPAVITNGAQHGLACVLAAIARPGETILADAVTYQGIGPLCHSLGLDLKPVAMDRAGMLAEDFLRACVEHRPRAVFLVPTLHNPTTITLSADRRLALAVIAREQGIIIVEDDVYRALKPDAPAAFAAIAPDITVHIGSLSKSIAPGLRIGAVFAPATLAGDVAAMLRINCWSISPLSALAAVRLIEDGHADRVVAGQRAEFALRQQMLRETLADFDVATDADSTHAWLQLPEPWRASAFARACARHGVGVLPGEAFAVGRDTAPHAVRINVGAARSHAELQGALTMVAGILAGSRGLLDMTL